MAGIVVIARTLAKEGVSIAGSIIVTTALAEKVVLSTRGIMVAGLKSEERIIASLRAGVSSFRPEEAVGFSGGVADARTMAKKRVESVACAVGAIACPSPHKCIPAAALILHAGLEAKIGVG